MNKVMYISFSRKRDIINTNYLEQMASDCGVYFVYKYIGFPRQIKPLLTSEEINNCDYIIFDADINNDVFDVSYNYRDFLFEKDEPRRVVLKDIKQYIDYPKSIIICDCSNSFTQPMIDVFTNSRGYVAMNKKISCTDNSIFFIKLFEELFINNLDVETALKKVNIDLPVSSSYKYIKGKYYNENQ